METLVFFIVITLLNVIISTIKSIVIVKSGPYMSGLISTVNATINALATLVISKQTNSWIVIIVTCLANLFAVTGTKLIMDKFKKARLWVYNATIKCSQDEITALRSKLKNEIGVHTTWETIVENQMYAVKMFVETREQSKVVKNQLNFLDSKYFIIEPR